MADIIIHVGTTTNTLRPFYSPSHSYHMDCVGLVLKGVLATALEVKVPDTQLSSHSVPNSYAMLMGPNKAATVFHGCH